jgi:hypothetical protein
VPDGGPGSGYDIVPLPAIVTINPTLSNEDNNLTLNIDVAFDPAEHLELNPIVTLLFDNIPAGFQIVGATYNPVNGKWVTSEAAVEAGHVYLIPPPNFSGTLPAGMTVEAIVTNNHFKSASHRRHHLRRLGRVRRCRSGTRLRMGRASASATARRSRTSRSALNITVAPRDTDAASPESLVEPILVRVPVGYSLSAGTATGTPGEFALTQVELAGLTLIPPVIPTHVHDVPIPITGDRHHQRAGWRRDILADVLHLADCRCGCAAGDGVELDGRRGWLHFADGPQRRAGRYRRLGNPVGEDFGHSGGLAAIGRRQ